MSASAAAGRRGIKRPAITRLQETGTGLRACRRSRATDRARAVTARDRLDFRFSPSGFVTVHLSPDATAPRADQKMTTP
jgi:hypothetical protein